MAVAFASDQAKDCGHDGSGSLCDRASNLGSHVPTVRILQTRLGGLPM